MSKQPMSGRPVCTWVAVTDASGRARMEARWTTVETVVQRASMRVRPDASVTATQVQTGLPDIGCLLM